MNGRKFIHVHFKKLHTGLRLRLGILWTRRSGNEKRTKTVYFSVGAAGRRIVFDPFDGVCVMCGLRFC